MVPCLAFPCVGGFLINFPRQAALVNIYGKGRTQTHIHMHTCNLCNNYKLRVWKLLVISYSFMFWGSSARSLQSCKCLCLCACVCVSAHAFPCVCVWQQRLSRRTQARLEGTWNVSLPASWGSLAPLQSLRAVHSRDFTLPHWRLLTNACP